MLIDNFKYVSFDAFYLPTLMRLNITYLFDSILQCKRPMFGLKVQYYVTTPNVSSFLVPRAAHAHGQNQERMQLDQLAVVDMYARGMSLVATHQMASLQASGVLGEDVACCHCQGGCRL